LNNLVSIIIPCYNQAKFLDDALNSVFHQKHENWECIIVNDGSVDNTEQVVNYWVEQDARFNYIYKNNSGLSSARNKGLEIAKGDYIQFLDADDFIEQNKLRISLEKIKNHYDLDIVISNFNLYNNDNRAFFPPYCNLNQEQLNYKTILMEWDKSFTIPIHCGFFKRKLFKEFRFPEHIKAKEDWLMWVSIFNGGAKAEFINQKLAFYRIHGSSMTQSKSMKADFMKAYIYLEDIISQEDYKAYTLSLISRLYDSQSLLKKELREIKQYKIFRLKYFIDKVSRRLNLKKK